MSVTTSAPANTTVDQENVSATLTAAVPAARVFAVLADPTTHAAIDGTGWVQEPVDRAPLTEVGQIFRMDMYHPDHPNGDYQVKGGVARERSFALWRENASSCPEDVPNGSRPRAGRRERFLAKVRGSAPERHHIWPSHQENLRIRVPRTSR